MARRLRGEVGDWVEDIRRDLLCPLCGEIFNLPQTFFGGCGHTLCLDCVSKILGPRCESKCPKCNCQVNKEQLGPNQALTNLVNRLRICLPIPGNDADGANLGWTSPGQANDTMLSTPDASKADIFRAADKGCRHITPNLCMVETVPESPEGPMNILSCSAPRIGKTLLDVNLIPSDPIKPVYDEDWLKNFISMPFIHSLESCRSINAEVEKIEKVLELGKSLLSGSVHMMPHENKGPGVGGAPVFNDSPRHGHRTAEIDAALKAFGFDMGRSVSPEAKLESERAYSMNGCDRKTNSSRDNDNNKKTGNLCINGSSGEVCKGDGSISELDALAAAHTTWTQDEIVVESAELNQGRIYTGKGCNMPDACAKGPADVGNKAQSVSTQQKRLRVKDKRHVHPTVAQTIDMGVPPPEPKKPRKRRKGMGQRVGRKRRAAEVANPPSAPRVRSKRHEIVAEAQGNTSRVDEHEKTVNDLSAKCELPILKSEPISALRVRRHRAVLSKDTGSLGEPDTFKPVTANFKSPTIEEDTRILAVRKSPEPETIAMQSPKNCPEVPTRRRSTNSDDKKTGPGRKRRQTVTTSRVRAKRRRREDMIGKHVEIYWDGMQSWYKGQILAFRGTRRDFQVSYEDGETHWELLPLQQEGTKWRMCDQNRMGPLMVTPQTDDQSILKPAASEKLGGQEKILAVSDTNDCQVLLVKSLCRNYGGVLAEDLNGDTTHLVIGGAEGSWARKRTEKMLRAICRDIPIVSHEWIIQSVTRGGWVEPEPFIIKGDKLRPMWGSASISDNQLFQGMEFVLQGIPEPTAALVKDLIIMGGGEIVDVPLRGDGDEEIVTLVDIKTGRKTPLRLPMLGLKPVCQYTWVFDSVCAKKCLPIDDYQA